MTIRIEVQNLDEVKRILEQLGPRAKGALPAAVEEGAKGPDKAHFYYAFFETGTSAHRVEPRTAQALHWGGDAFSAGHAVGGVASTPFMRPAVDEGADEVGAAVGRVLVEALE